MRIVKKYGGSSVASIEQIKLIAQQLKLEYHNNKQMIIVVSAMGKSTNNLIDLAYSFTKEPCKRDLDFLLNTGEMVSASLLSIALNAIGVPSICLTGYQAGFLTNESFGKAFIENIDSTRIIRELDNNKIVVVTGFQGITNDGELTTFGRGGSDTTAVAIAYATNAICEIYTDVDCVKFTDPRKNIHAKPIKNINYEQMLLLAVSGAKVLDARCLEIAKKYMVPIYLGKTLELERGGTLVLKKEYFEKMQVVGISEKHDLVAFYVIAKNSALVMQTIKDMLVCNQFFCVVGDTICFVIEKEKENKAALLLHEVGIMDFKKENDLCGITIVGTGFATHHQAELSVLNLLHDNGICLYLHSVSELAINLFVKKEDSSFLLNSLVNMFGGVYEKD